jgi:hypothetical protein
MADMNLFDVDVTVQRRRDLRRSRNSGRGGRWKEEEEEEEENLSKLRLSIK